MTDMQGSQGAARDGSVPGAAGRILVVDDNRLNRIKLAHSLGQQGHTVSMAENGRQTLEMLRAQPFDLVMLDILMPEMDGYQVLEEMKKDSALREIPVIVISAVDEMESVVRCIEMGAEDYLPKPFDPVLLRARTGACLEKKRLRDQELEYLRQVDCLTHAAAAVEAGNFQPDCLSGVAARLDALGQLGRVFQRMATEVKAREERLQREVQALRIQIDESKKARQVAEITETEYFRGLREKAQSLRTPKEGKA
jgi:two-component system, cell cycle response regulator